MKICAIILTLNEEIHISRAIESLTGFATSIYVVDSGSSDRTVGIAKSLGAKVLSHPFTTHADQLNWALENIDTGADWILRLDADEYLIKEDVENLLGRLTSLPQDVSGCTLRLRRVFQGQWLRWGGLYPIRLLRLWRAGQGRAEARMMDEHVAVNGKVIDLNFDFCDHDLRDLGTWTKKHLWYAEREALDYLRANREATGPSSTGARRTRAFKGMYYQLPSLLRPALYFCWRYFLRLGFLDGVAGYKFHFFQAMWYRTYVDHIIGTQESR